MNNMNTKDIFRRACIVGGVAALVLCSFGLYHTRVSESFFLPPSEGFIPGTFLVRYRSGMRDLRIPQRDYRKSYAIYRDINNDEHVDLTFLIPKKFLLFCPFSSLEKEASTFYFSRTNQIQTERFNKIRLERIDQTFERAIDVYKRYHDHTSGK